MLEYPKIPKINMQYIADDISSINLRDNLRNNLN